MIKPYYENSLGKIYHGDCLDVLQKVTEKPDLILCNPPYGVNYAEWDKSIPKPEEWMGLVKYNICLITPGNGNQHIYPKPDWTIGWFRPGSIQRCRNGTGFSHWEPVLLYGENRFSYDAKAFNANTGASGYGHPCAKPLSLWIWLIEQSKTDGVILDPFLGSGTTAVAAMQLNRRFIGIEIEEKYCEIAAKRCEQARTGLTPEEQEAGQQLLFE